MAKNFIQKSIKNPGALRATAKREGLIKGDEKLSKTDLNKLSKSKNKTTQKRANLAKTFNKIRSK